MFKIGKKKLEKFLFRKRLENIWNYKSIIYCQVLSRLVTNLFIIMQLVWLISNWKCLLLCVKVYSNGGRFNMYLILYSNSKKLFKRSRKVVLKVNVNQLSLPTKLSEYADQHALKLIVPTITNWKYKQIVF